MKHLNMRRNWVRGSAAVVLAAALAILTFSIPNRFSVIQPASDLRSYASIPAVLAEPAFYAGPIPSGFVIDQELFLTDRDIAIRIWLGSAYVGQRARARIELLAGPQGPSLRSATVDVPPEPRRLVVRIVPPPQESEYGPDGKALFRIAPTVGSRPIRVGMAQGETYRPGRAFIGGEPLAEGEDFMFEVAQATPPDEVWSAVWRQIDGNALPQRIAVATISMALAAVLAARVSARARRTHAVLVVALAAAVAAAIIVVDRTPLDVFPGPDFTPDVVLR